MFAYDGLGNTKKALELGEKLVPLCIDTLGEHDKLTCDVMHMLSRSYRKVGRLEEALELCKRVSERQATFLSDDYPSFLWSKHELALTYITKGLYHEGVVILRHLVEKRKIALADDHIDTLVSQVQLAGAYDDLGQPGTGIPLLVNAIRLGEKAGVAEVSLQKWRKNLARLQAHEAIMLWERPTEPFQPDVIISLMVDAIELGEKSGESGEVLQDLGDIIQEWRSHEAKSTAPSLKPLKAKKAGGDC